MKHAVCYDTMFTSEWGTPNMIGGGLNPEILMQSGYGHQLHVGTCAVGGGVIFRP